MNEEQPEQFQIISINDYSKMTNPCDALFHAMSRAQGKIGPAEKNCANPFFKSKYADTASINQASRTILAEHGLCVIQTTGAAGPKVTVTTILAHNSGQWISSQLELLVSDGKPQSVGSALTYGRRYGLSAILNMATEDEDDGNAASTAGPVIEMYSGKDDQKRRISHFLTNVGITSPELWKDFGNVFSGKPMNSIGQAVIEFKKSLNQL